MIDYLAAVFADLYYVVNTYIKYKELTIGKAKAFTDFYVSFLHLASNTEILTDNWLFDLY